MYYTDEQIEKIKKAVPIAAVLSKFGNEPVQSGPRFLAYLSPFRGEKEPSFHVNKAKNLYVDRGDNNKGGNVITLVMKLCDCDFPHACAFLIEQSDVLIPDEAQVNIVAVPVQTTDYVPDWQVEQEDTVKYDYVDEMPIRTYSILKYLEGKRIHLSTAERYCCELHYGKGNKRYYGLGFKNDNGGYEVRFTDGKKRCIGHKAPTTIHNGEHSECCVLFEGFTDFLAYKQLLDHGSDLCVKEKDTDYIILNSVSTLKNLLDGLGKYERIYCYLDNDDAGRAATRMILQRYPEQAYDQSERYTGYKDVNAFLIG